MAFKMKGWSPFTKETDAVTGKERENGEKPLQDKGKKVTPLIEALPEPEKEPGEKNNQKVRKVPAAEIIRETEKRE